MESVHHRFQSIQKIGLQTKWTQDLYHSLLTASWRKFFLSYLVFFILFNLIFAWAYWQIPHTIEGTDGSLWHAFAFSVQTFSTVGYGAFHPQSDWSHVVVIIESILSVFVTALLTGIVFAKFSRPNARILFSNHVLINQFDGKKTLMLRIGNLRANQIAEAQVKLMALKTVLTSEGQMLRRQFDLKLVRDTSLFFSLSWTIMHVIDETSPLYGLSAEDILRENVELGLSLIGYDGSFSQTIHANCMYNSKDFIFGRYFEDIMQMEKDKVISINYEKFNLLKPLESGAVLN